MAAEKNAEGQVNKEIQLEEPVHRRREKQAGKSTPVSLKRLVGERKPPWGNPLERGYSN